MKNFITKTIEEDVQYVIQKIIVKLLDVLIGIVYLFIVTVHVAKNFIWIV